MAVNAAKHQFKERAQIERKAHYRDGGPGDSPQLTVQGVIPAVHPAAGYNSLAERSFVERLL